MSLSAADSLSNGFENPLESHLHGVDGFWREHTTLPAPEVTALQGGIENLLYQGGDYGSHNPSSGSVGSPTNPDLK